MEKNTGFKEEDLKEVIEDVKSFAYEVNPKFLSTLKYKFTKPEYFEVANIPFKFWVNWSVNDSLYISNYYMLKFILLRLLITLLFLMRNKSH